jgi:hypothetical protein
MNVSCGLQDDCWHPGDPIEIHIAVRIYMARSGNTLNSEFGFIPGV